MILEGLFKTLRVPNHILRSEDLLEILEMNKKIEINYYGEEVTWDTGGLCGLDPQVISTHIITIIFHTQFIVYVIYSSAFILGV